MKTLLSFLAVACLLQAQIAIAATDTECQKNFGLDVSGCAQVTPGSKKACVEDAKVAKVACLSGVNLCMNTCQSTYDSSVVTCKANNDPSVCGGFYDCEQVILQQQTDCIATASGTRTSCQASCQQ